MTSLLDALSGVLVVAAIVVLLAQFRTWKDWRPARLLSFAGTALLGLALLLSGGLTQCHSSVRWLFVLGLGLRLGSDALSTRWSQREGREREYGHYA